MPAKADAAVPNRETNNTSFTEDYLGDWGSDDDPFRSPSPPPGAGGASNKKTNEKKRKGDDILGIDEQIDLTKKARVPRVKLDETRLMSEKGIPELQRRAKKLRLKGKGHEFGDAARLLSFYQQWLDDLFPKATFLDALAMVEKAGHKTVLKNHRIKWIDESKPKASVSFDDDDPFGEGGSAAPRQPSRIAPIFEKSASAAPRTGGTPDNDHPGHDDLFGDDDIYDATPKRDKGPPRAGPGGGNDVPDDDDLDALMAEAEGNGMTTQTRDTVRTTIPPSFGSIFGGGTRTSKPVPRPQAPPSGEPDEDDLDALMAEAEAQSAAAPPRAAKTGPATSIFGGGERLKEAGRTVQLDDDEDDLDALMAEAEATVLPPAAAKAKETSKETEVSSPSTLDGDREKEVEKPKPKPTTSQDYDDDDLDALMAEAEGVSSSTAAAPKPNEGQNQDKGKDTSLEDEEEAMAEMDGLW